MTQKAVSAWVGTLEQMQSEVETLRDKWQDTYDNRTEKWQESEKGEAMSARIDSIGYALDDIENVISNLNGMDWDS